LITQITHFIYHIPKKNLRQVNDGERFSVIHSYSS
jgi:hypothetical protein